MLRAVFVVLLLVVVAGLGGGRAVSSRAAADPGDPESPIPVGVEASIGGGWIASVPEAAADVSDGYPGGPAVDPVWTDSYRYLLIPVRLVYRGELPIAFAYDQVALSAETWEDHEYTSYTSGPLTCIPQGGVPDEIDLSATRTPTDAAIEGNVCVEVSRGDERPLFLRVQGPDSSLSGFYFAIDGVPGAAAVSTVSGAVAEPTATPLPAEQMPAAAAGRPPLAGSPEAPAVVSGGGVRQTTWGDGGLPLLDAAGEAASWALMSIRMAQNAVGMSTFAEVRNVSAEAAGAPRLTVELVRSGTGFGVKELSPINDWVPAGASVYYQSDLLFADELYDGTFDFGGWDEERYGAVNREPGGSGEDPGLRLEGGVVFNAGATDAPLGGLALVVVDSAGVFSGHCVSVGTGQLIAPGTSLSVPGPLAAGELPDCPPADRGMSASESLGVGGPFAVVVVLI